MSIRLWSLMTCGMMVSGAGMAAAPSYSPRVGEPHPDFTLPRMGTGAPVSLSQFRGKKVLLIHFSSW